VNLLDVSGRELEATGRQIAGEASEAVARRAARPRLLEGHVDPWGPYAPRVAHDQLGRGTTALDPRPARVRHPHPLAQTEREVNERLHLM